MSTTFTFKRTKGGRTHYVASVIPKTTVIDGFTDDPAKAKVFSEADGKALWAVLEADPKVYGRWAVVDAAGREVSVFTHATPEPKKPAGADALVTAKSTGYVDFPVGMVENSEPAADYILADEPDNSPFRELAELFELDGSQTLGELAHIAMAEIKTIRESLDELTAPPKDDHTAIIDTTTGPAK